MILIVPPFVATLSIIEFPLVAKALKVSPLPFDSALILNWIDILGFGASILGVIGGITVVGSNDGNPAIVTFFWIFGFTFDIDFGVIDALIGISAFGS